MSDSVFRVNLEVNEKVLQKSLEAAVVSLKATIADKSFIDSTLIEVPAAGETAQATAIVGGATIRVSGVARAFGGAAVSVYAHIYPNAAPANIPSSGAAFPAPDGGALPNFYYNALPVGQIGAQGAAAVPNTLVVWATYQRANGTMVTQITITPFSARL